MEPHEPSGPVAPSDRPTARRSHRRLLRVVGIALLSLFGVLTMLSALQTRMIFPGAATQGVPEAVVRPPAGTELVTLTTARGERVVALFGPALTPHGAPRPDAARCPTILFFYGNGMCLRSAEDELTLFRRLGANVMIPEYVGYGMSGGSPSEAGCYATADAAYDHLAGRMDVDPRQIVASGWSLGGAVAVDLAARREVAGLAVFSTFTSLSEMARRALPFVPTSLLLRHKFDSLAKIGRVTCPVLVGHGRNDGVVPHDMAARLAAAAKAPVTRYTVEGADHNDFFVIGAGQTADQLRRFLARLSPEG